MLNELLYRNLLSKFGSVKIAKAGQPLLWVPDELGRGRIRVIDYGETYRVNCPFCAKRGDADTRHRLWISHAYGSEVKSQRRWNLATCFHNNCLQEPWARDELRNMISTARYMSADPNGLNCVSDVTSFALMTYHELPGSCIRISELDIKHKANQFLLSRGLDPYKADKDFEIYYCFDSEKFPQAIDKIVFPVIFNGERVGWQCRYLGTPPDKKVPKYFTAPGWSIKSFIYNYDRAIEQDYIVIVEGILDVLKVGIKAVALFGKTASARQIKLLSDLGKPIVIFLDPDAREDAVKLEAELSKTNQVFNVLDADRDPGKHTKEELDACFGKLFKNVPKITYGFNANDDCGVDSWETQSV